LPVDLPSIRVQRSRTDGMNRQFMLKPKSVVRL
jgi:hypothetical protein